MGLGKLPKCLNATWVCILALELSKADSSRGWEWTINADPGEEVPKWKDHNLIWAKRRFIAKDTSELKLP